MKILTWNINGIRGNKGLGLKQLLDSLDADVICLQETKVSREQLDEASAIVDGYNSYFSFSRARAGYSGVATFVRDGAMPCKAEDGLTGLSHEGDEELCIGHYGDHSSFAYEELESLDREGRCVMTQHIIRDSSGVEKDLVIINVYCPRADPDNDVRKSYKMRFYQLLQSRAETILKSGRHVIVLGDINTSHRKIDHCDPTNDEEFYANPGRKWLDGFLYDPASDGNAGVVNEPTEHNQFIDTFRLLHPEQLNAFTNWSSATGARGTNYGCRLDYIFADRNLARHFFVQCFIMPDVMGSDHCPVKAVLDCSVVAAKKCPPLCTRFMLQFSGKQQKLSMFLIKTSKLGSGLAKSQSVESSQSSGNCDFESVDQEESSFDDVKQSGERNVLDMTDDDGTSSSQATNDVEMDVKCINDCFMAEDLNSKISCTSNGLPFSQKRVLNDSRKSADTMAKKSKVETQLARKQSNLLNFLVKSPQKKEGESKDIKSFVENTSLQHDGLNSNSKSRTDYVAKDDDRLNEKDGEKVEARTEAPTPELSACTLKTDSMPSSSDASNSTSAWKSLLKGPPQTPLCKGHKELCALRTVKKSGPNRGRQFWTCNRPEGHKTNPEARCDYFVWVSNKK